MPQFSLDPPLASLRDHEECRAAIRTGSRSFYGASRLLPPSVRRPAFGLYAFCRLSDDAVDLEGGATAALERLRDRILRASEGRPLALAADRTMADLLRCSAIPLAVPLALLEGLAWDAEGRTYERLDDLFDYAVRVAGTVGVMMTLLMGVRSRRALARACDLGVAMQLTNIARDVGEDAESRPPLSAKAMATGSRGRRRRVDCEPDPVRRDSVCRRALARSRGDALFALSRRRGAASG